MWKSLTEGHIKIFFFIISGEVWVELVIPLKYDPALSSCRSISSQIGPKSGSLAKKPRRTGDALWRMSIKSLCQAPLVKPPPHEVQAGALDDGDVYPSVRMSLPVRLSSETRTQNAVFSKTKQFRATVSIDDR